jgi:hypothetical protein
MQLSALPSTNSNAFGTTTSCAFALVAAKTVATTIRTDGAIPENNLRLTKTRRKIFMANPRLSIASFASCETKNVSRRKMVSGREWTAAANSLAAYYKLNLPMYLTLLFFPTTVPSANKESSVCEHNSLDFYC